MREIGMVPTNLEADVGYAGVFEMINIRALFVCQDVYTRLPRERPT